MNHSELKEVVEFFRLFFLDERNRKKRSLKDVVDCLKKNGLKIDVSKLSRMEAGKANLTPLFIQDYLAAFQIQPVRLDEWSENYSKSKTELGKSQRIVEEFMLYGLDVSSLKKAAQEFRAADFANTYCRFDAQALSLYLGQKEYSDSYLSRELSYMEEVINNTKHSIKIIDSDIQALIYYTHGIHYMDLDDETAAVMCFKQAFKIADGKRFKHFPEMIRYARLRATSQWANLMEAVEECDFLIDFFNSGCLFNRTLDVQNLKGIYLVRAGQYCYARRIFQDVLEFSKRFNFPTKVGYVGLNLVWLETSAGNYEKALKIHQTYQPGSYEFQRGRVYKPLCTYKLYGKQRALFELCSLDFKGLYDEDLLFLKLFRLFLRDDPEFESVSERVRTQAQNLRFYEIVRWIFELQEDWYEDRGNLEELNQSLKNRMEYEQLSVFF